MRKLLVFLFVLASVTATAQSRKLFAASNFDINGFSLSIVNASDSMFRAGTTSIGLLKPVQLKGVPAASGSFNALAIRFGDSTIVQVSGGLISGGSTNVIPRYGSTSTLVNSALTDDGTSVGIGRPTQVTGNLTTTGALAVTGTQVISSGTATTINSSVTRVIVDPGSVLASHTITMPASPQDGQYIEIYFGGSVGGGATVVTSLTISANTGQTLIQPTTPSTAVGGDWISYQYYSATGRWYRRK